MMSRIRRPVPRVLTCCRQWYALWSMEGIFPCQRLMALLSRADCICLWWWDRAAGCIWTPPHEGPFCPPCWRNPSTRSPLPHIPSTQRACCCEEHSSPGHGSPGVLCIAKLHHPLSGWWHSTAQLGWESEERQRGLSPPSSLEILGNVSFPCGSKPLSSQSPRSWFRLLASFPAQQEVAFLSWWQLQMSIPVYPQKGRRMPWSCGPCLCSLNFSFGQKK